METPKVVVIGNSYSSAAVFYSLEEYLSKSRQPFDILFISTSNCYFFKGLLPQYLCNVCDFSELGQDFRGTGILRPGISYINSKVLGIDFPKQLIKTSENKINYDYLVLAPELDLSDENGLLFDRNCFLFTSLKDAIRLKNHIMKTLEQAVLETDIEKKKTLLTFSVIGAQIEGVELVCSLNDFIKSLLNKRFPELNKSFVKISLIEQENLLCSGKNSFYNSFLLYTLNKKGIKILTNSKVTKLTDDTVVINNDKKTNSHTVIFSGTNKFSSLIKELNLQKDEKSKAQVDIYLKAQGFDNVFVIGESSKCIDLAEELPRGISFYKEEAKTCAHNVFAKINNNPLKTIKIYPEAHFVLLGDRSSLVEIKRFCFSGYIGWLLNRFVYVSCYLGAVKKMKTFVSLLISIFGLKDTITFNMPDVFESDSLNEKHSEVAYEKSMVKK